MLQSAAQNNGRNELYLVSADAGLGGAQILGIGKGKVQIGLPLVARLALPEVGFEQGFEAKAAGRGHIGP